MEPTRYRIVFKKLSEAIAEEGEREKTLVEIKSIRTESEEIAELRRLVLETTESEPRSYTST